MRESTKIIKELARATGALVKGDVGSGFVGYRFPEGTTAGRVKVALLYTLLDLSVDLGIRDKIDKDSLEKELGI